MSTPTASSYAEKTARLKQEWRSGAGHLRLAKSTISNLFRYQPRGTAVRRLSLAAFNGVLSLDSDARTAEVEGLATYETVVRHCLAHGFLPLVAPELKHITVGGATVGIGIESTCFRYGFVHDGLIEADVLLPGGDIVTCRADNEYADLFRALPNSYGTLGYSCARRSRCTPQRRTCTSASSVSTTPRNTSMRCGPRPRRQELDFVEGLFFEGERFFLMTGTFATQVPHCDDIVREDIFYRLVETRRDIYLATADYIFRYDPDWFWNVPETAPYWLFRRFAPLPWRNSSFYTKYVATKKKLLGSVGLNDASMEPLIQDWQVPWAQGRGARALLPHRSVARRTALGGGADQDSASTDSLPDHAEGAVLQSRLLLPGAETRRQGALLLHEDHGSKVLRARRHQDAVFVVVLERSGVRRAVQRCGLPRAEAKVRQGRQRANALQESRARVRALEKSGSGSVSGTAPAGFFDRAHH